MRKPKRIVDDLFVTKTSWDDFYDSASYENVEHRPWDEYQVEEPDDLQY